MGVRAQVGGLPRGGSRGRSKVLWLALCLAPAWAQARVTAPRPQNVAPSQADTVCSAPLGTAVGHVDWTHRSLHVRAHGAPPIHAYVPELGLPFAQRRAEAMAQAKLTAMLRALPVGPGVGGVDAEGNAITVGDLLQQDPKLLGVAHAMTAAMQIVASTYHADGAVEIEVTLSLDGGQGTPGPLWVALWRSLHGGSATDPVACVPPWTAAPQAPGAQAAPTGVVIVAAGPAPAPALWPKIVDARGADVYGPGQVHPDIWQTQGLMGVTRSLSAALRDPRVAEHALIVKAVASAGQAGGTWVLGDADAAQVRRLPQLLAEGRVMLVIHDEP